MKVIVLANDILKEELMMQGIVESLELEWTDDPALFAQRPSADAYMDLLFKPNKERVSQLNQLAGKPVIVSLVDHTLANLPSHFVRINGWNTFLKRPVIEASCNNDIIKGQAEIIFSAFNKKTAWLPDTPGFITARVVAMIINEAYFALGENVSTRQEIDTAMKLGTNYPFGPFEWSKKIGLKNIAGLLEALYKEESRYLPAELLKTESGI